MQVFISCRNKINEHKNYLLTNFPSSDFLQQPFPIGIPIGKVWVPRWICREEKGQEQRRDTKSPALQERSSQFSHSSCNCFYFGVNNYRLQPFCCCVRHSDMKVLWMKDKKSGKDLVDRCCQAAMKTVFRRTKNPLGENENKHFSLWQAFII